MSQTIVKHSNKLDMCRICLFEPETDSVVKLLDIHTPVTGIGQVKDLMLEFLGINDESNDFKPKKICDNCFNKLLTYLEMKKKVAESEVIIKYLISKKFGVNMPRSIESTPSLMITNNGESSQESSFQHSQFSQRSNMYGASTSGLCIASTSSQFGVNMPRSIESTPSLMITNNGESSQESSYQHSQLSPRSNMYGASTSGLCIASTSSQLGVNKPGTSIESSFQHSTSRVSIASTSSQYQFIPNSGFFDDSDDDSDDSCIDVTAPNPTDDLISDDEENKLTLKNEKLYYCSICQKKNILHHDCSQHTKSFFTCLVPNCNVLSRSKEDFISHYELHIGMSSSAIMCSRCFKELGQSNNDRNGSHIHCDTVSGFKCYTCDVKFDDMQEFAFHKLKTHNGLLMDVHGNYLCLHCEESSSEPTDINEHMKQCLKNQAKNASAAKMKLKKPTVNKTSLLPVIPNNKNNRSVRKNKIKKKIPLTSEHVLFSCLKPCCNLIFHTFKNFKLHHRLHFKIQDPLVCWQCCKPFNNATELRRHIVNNSCRTPGMFKCPECSEKFDDIEQLSIHKFNFHECKLKAGRKNKKTIMCAFCQMKINIFNFLSHLNTCKKKNVNKNTSTEKHNGTLNCLTCGKVFNSSISLSNHSRIHKQS